MVILASRRCAIGLPPPDFPALAKMFSPDKALIPGAPPTGIDGAAAAITAAAAFIAIGISMAHKPQGDEARHRNKSEKQEKSSLNTRIQDAHDRSPATFAT